MPLESGGLLTTHPRATQHSTLSQLCDVRALEEMTLGVAWGWDTRWVQTGEGDILVNPEMPQPVCYSRQWGLHSRVTPGSPMAPRADRRCKHRHPRKAWTRPQAGKDIPTQGAQMGRCSPDSA